MVIEKTSTLAMQRRSYINRTPLEVEKRREAKRIKAPITLPKLTVLDDSKT
jgi:hypothetical protein